MSLSSFFCTQLNDQTVLFQSIKHKSFVLFYCMSTIIDNLMPNPVYTYILDIYDL